jgi:hypothetical protein
VLFSCLFLGEKMMIDRKTLFIRRAFIVIYVLLGLVTILLGYHPFLYLVLVFAGGNFPPVA